MRSHRSALAAPTTDRATGTLLAQLEIDDGELTARLADGLEAAEKGLQDTAATAADPRIAELTGHLAAFGGKRLRPLLVLLGAEFGEPWRAGVTEAAVIAELVHVSSLYHDDVMDAATTRHGVPSANARWGERSAVFGGDWLLARAAKLSAALGAETIRLNAEAAGRLVTGQLRELMGPAPGEDPVDHYFQVLNGKTAALFSLALAIGAHQAGAPTASIQALDEYGRQLGLAFQIADDLLDLTAPVDWTGKERGKDLATGVASLPVLLARADESADGAELREILLAGPLTDTAVRQRALELFRTSPALATTEDMMHRRLARARAAIQGLAPHPAHQALHALCAFMAARTA
ncbi:MULTISPECIES: polyprenyl synthetase family protein [Streptomyces]|uniref:polyprenyl synthetase family protein n=1 Tax=Streptomyces TaxID=1883 RepID=UPI00081D97BA|nr:MULTISPECIES: polyprenyl synthetase family protein [Streptomyces]UCA53978.1 polyprenyl synthetase family protein [Streptomyces sp. WA6-1-16]GGS27963.1 geranylgeranyl pyrophosphate synthase [Streptomyces parvus]SCF83615.1 heptaprenyl diphosphate synthase [Streptomyces sp. Cmuel-A718b]